MTSPASSAPVPSLLSALFPPGVASVSVAEFMAAALYHPDCGYYTRQIRAVGRRGDFSTGPAVSDLWGQALARWAVRHRPANLGLGLGRRWHLIEVGGGGGDLAFALLKALGWWGRRGLVYHLVEISKQLQALQEKRLKGWPVRWHATIEAALAEAGGRALILSNELVDAFPCEQFVRRGGEWRQVRLQLEEGRLQELEAPTTSLPSSSAFARASTEGDRIEVHASYREWLSDWRGLWKEGAMVTVDYGDLVDAVYHRRPRGTLRGYAHHQLLEGTDLYASPGKRDLTADVNFTDLQAWGEELGLKNEPLATQAGFLRRWAPPGAVDSEDPALRYLLAEEGMGGAFKVLEQRPKPD